jgi:hypothetical protein
MGKQRNKAGGIVERLRDILREIDRLLNPPQPVPARVPVRQRPR